MKKCFFCHERDFREIGFARLPGLDGALGRSLRRSRSGICTRAGGICRCEGQFVKSVELRITAPAGLSIPCESNADRYSWKLNIVSTIFWIGETGEGPTNARSAWDPNWLADFGGIDDPQNRRGYEPLKFMPRENPFYVALPYCDMRDSKLKPEAATLVPWFIQKFRNQKQSVCKDRWLAIRHGMNVCYSQWEDVGPFRTDHAQYYSATNVLARTTTRALESMSRPPCGTSWGFDLWTWLTGNSWNKAKCRLGRGQCTSRRKWLWE
jgi:hypothetical protein